MSHPPGVLRRSVTRNPQFDYTKPYGIRPYTWLASEVNVPTQIVLTDQATGVKWYPFYDESFDTLGISDAKLWARFEMVFRDYAARFVEFDHEFFVRDADAWYRDILSAGRRDAPFLVPSKQDRDKLFRVYTKAVGVGTFLAVDEYVVSA